MMMKALTFTVLDLPIYDFYDANDHKYYLFTTNLEKEYGKLFLWGYTIKLWWSHLPLDLSFITHAEIQLLTEKSSAPQTWRN